MLLPQRVRPLSKVRAAVCLVLSFLSASCGPSYPKERIVNSLVELCRKEYKLDVKAQVVDTTLGVEVAAPGLIEELMRNEVFHSTLDWQSAKQLEGGARKAKAIFEDDREFFLQVYAERRALFRKERREAEAAKNAAPHEI